ncbi:hypothetical protein TcWFU_008308 [Taenia crassiceps]|uniref:Uncharacterized protein n=1 Tax=Taenia crassiceps TaxID=6207 RepID=A0ABR4QBM9_9CEST
MLEVELATHLSLQRMNANGAALCSLGSGGNASAALPFSQGQRNLSFVKASFPVFRSLLKLIVHGCNGNGDFSEGGPAHGLLCLSKLTFTFGGKADCTEFVAAKNGRF